MVEFQFKEYMKATLLLTIPQITIYYEEGIWVPKKFFGIHFFQAHLVLCGYLIACTIQFNIEISDINIFNTMPKQICTVNFRY